MNKDVAFVANCGNSKRVIARVGETYYVGCFEGSYNNLIAAISEKYKGQERIDYLAKVDLLKNSCLEDFKDIIANDNYAINFSVEYGILDAVKYLHRKGANINVPVYKAVRKGHLDIVKYLHKNGADITAYNNYAVLIAAMKGELATVKYLHKNGSDITVNSNYAVRWANIYGHKKVVKYLLANGATL